MPWNFRLSFRSSLAKSRARLSQSALTPASAIDSKSSTWATPTILLWTKEKRELRKQHYCNVDQLIYKSLSFSDSFIKAKWFIIDYSVLGRLDTKNRGKKRSKDCPKKDKRGGARKWKINFNVRKHFQIFYALRKLSLSISTTTSTEEYELSNRG